MAGLKETEQKHLVDVNEEDMKVSFEQVYK